MPSIATSVLIPHAPDAVWLILKDVRAVAGCMPGVELTDDLGDGAFKGRLKTRLGAISATFEGEATIEMNDADRTGTVDARGVDVKGGTRASAAVSYAARDADGATDLGLVANIELRGRLAQFGKSGLLQEISNQMVRTFAGNLAELVATGTASAPASEIRVAQVVRRALWARVKAFFARPWRRSPGK